jgi:predicted acetyltransferase
MIEVRAPRCEELDAMLRVLCTVFEMDFEAARSIFLKDPYFDISRKRVLLSEGEIVSCLTLTQSELTLRGCIVPVTGVAGVATLPQHRGRGYAGRLAADAVATAHSQQTALLGLMAHRPEYYQRLGFAVCSESWRLVAPRFALPAWEETRRVRPYRPSDIEEMMAVRAEMEGAQPGRAVRDTRRWGCILHHTRHVVCAAWSRVEGYALYDIHPTEEFTRIRVIECMGATPRARRALAGWFAACSEGEVVDFSGDLATLQHSGLLDSAADSHEAASLQRMPGVMFRTAHFETAVRCIAPAMRGFRGRLALQLHDPLCPNWSDAVCVEGDGSDINCSEIVKRPVPEETLMGGPGAWAEVLSGARGLDEAISLGRIRAGVRALQQIGELLPRYMPFLPSADHF